MGLPLMFFVSSSSSAFGSTTSSSFSSLGLRRGGGPVVAGVVGVARVDGVAAASRRRCSAAAPAYGAGGASTVSFGVLAPRVANSKRAPPVSKAVFSRFYTAAHLSDGMSITLKVGAGVASAGASAASARGTARGARTWHCGAIRPAAPAKDSANTTLCILARLVLATGARTPRLRRDLGCALASVSTPLT